MSYNILIVDDSVIVRSMVKKSLNMSGVDVGEIQEAADGAEALRILSDSWIDIVFTDLHMPGMNGLELVERMVRDDLLGRIPVVIVSSDHSRTRIEDLKRRGIRAYIKKPFRPECFRDVVADVLGSGGDTHAD